MSRKKRDVVDYFPHYTNACNGDTLTVLQSRYGNDGYAFWFKLLEKLAGTEGHCLDLSNPIKWQVFVAKMGISEITTVEMLNLLVEMQAIDKELWASKLIWCQNLVDNLADVYKNRRREIPKKPITTVEKGITTVEMPQSRVEYSKGYILHIYSLWNEQKIIEHKKLTPAIKASIEKILKDYSVEDVEQSIKNYATILKSPDLYYFKYKWTLQEFLTRNKGNNIERFLDIETAKANFKRDASNGNGHKEWTGLAGNKPTGVFKDVLE